MYINEESVRLIFVLFGAVALLISFIISVHFIKRIKNDRLKRSLYVQVGASLGFFIAFVCFGFYSHNDYHEELETLTALVFLFGGGYVLLTAILTKSRVLLLLDLSLNLEEKVEEKTRELIDANQTLKDNFAKIKEAQENALFYAEVASVGRIVGQLAHEMNSPLGGILLSVNSALQEVDSEEFHHEQIKFNLNLMKRAGEKMQRVILALSRSYGASSNVPSLIEFNSLLDDIKIVLAEAVAREGIDLKISNDVPSSTSVWGKPQEINYIATALLKYAIDLAKYSPTKMIEAVSSEEQERVRITIRSSVFLDSLNPFSVSLPRDVLQKTIEKNKGSLDLTRQNEDGTIVLYLSSRNFEVDDM